MVVVDVQVAFAADVDVDHAVAGDLVDHVFEEGYAGIQPAFAAAVEVDGDGDLGFAGIAVDGNGAAAGSRCGFGNLDFGSSGAFCGGFGDSAFVVFSVEPAFGFAGVFFEFCHQAGTDAARIGVFCLLFKALFEFVECDGGTVAAEFGELGQ